MLSAAPSAVCVSQIVPLDLEALLPSKNT